VQRDARDDASSCRKADGASADSLDGVARDERSEDMCWRDHASDRVISGDADERIVCSLTIRKVFVLTLSFQAKVFLLLKLENVAFAM